MGNLLSFQESRVSFIIPTEKELKCERLVDKSNWSRLLNEQAKQQDQQTKLF